MCNNEYPKFFDLTYDYDIIDNSRLVSALAELQYKLESLEIDYNRVSSSYVSLSNDYYKLKAKYDNLYDKFKDYKSENAYHNFKDKFVIEFDKIDFDDIVKILDYLKR